MKKNCVLTFVLFSWQLVNAQNVFEKIKPVNFANVQIQDAFWLPKMEKVATKTIDACIYQTEFKTARIRNFEKVARKKGEAHEGVFYDDSDVFKALEAMSYAIKTNHDPKLINKADEWIEKIVAAQLPDGYLNTYYTLLDLNKRWTDMSMHEDYNAGHMIEAGVAYFEATGKRKLLDACIKWADYFDSVFGPGKRLWVTGHEELELALVKLYRVTNNKKYLDLSDWLLSERGKRLAVGYTWTDWKDTAYAQDVLPVKEQKEITGHAVRAMYLYTGAADVATYTKDIGYLNAMKNVWEDVVYRNMYITGGIGSAGSNEGFTNDYDLPNEHAYCETCASVGMVFWNQRMNQLTGDATYYDVLEKSLYNAALDGLSISGDRFFYGNPLASTGKNARREWFGTACCPANIARLITSLGNYIYGYNDSSIFVNLFIGSKAVVPMQKQNITIETKTNYPWDGVIETSIFLKTAQKLNLAFRAPGWSRGIASPGNLYAFTNYSEANPVKIVVNGQAVPYQMVNGYMVVQRKWSNGDKVQFAFDMPIQKVVSSNAVVANKDRIALQKGPLLYCIEGADNEGQAWNFIVPETTPFKEVAFDVLTEHVIALEGQLPVVSFENNQLKTNLKTIRAIPYYTWCNRGSNPMQLWLPNQFKELKINY